MNGTAKDTLVVYRLSKLVKKRVRPPVGESIVSESIAKYGPSNCGDSLHKLSGELWDMTQLISKLDGYPILAAR